MKYALIENNTVVQIQPYHEEGFRKVDNSVSCGMVEDEQGLFSPPPIADRSIEDQISDLEASITARNIRAALIGDQFAIDKIQSTEQQISELRTLL